MWCLLLLKVGVLSIVPLGISRLQYRFVVGGYVRKRVMLRISKGLRAVSLAAGISQRVYSNTRVISIIIITIYIALAEKIGTPLIILITERQVDHDVIVGGEVRSESIGSFQIVGFSLAPVSSWRSICLDQFCRSQQDGKRSWRESVPLT
jgi:hypothetical protein